MSTKFYEFLNRLQIYDYNKVGIPTNWPNNELFEDKTIEMLKKRKNMAKTGKIEGLDWWFCYTPSNKQQIFVKILTKQISYFVLSIKKLKYFH